MRDSVETSYLGFPVLLTETSATVTVDGRATVLPSMKQMRLFVKGWRKEAKEATA